MHAVELLVILLHGLVTLPDGLLAILLTVGDGHLDILPNAVGAGPTIEAGDPVLETHIEADHIHQTITAADCPTPIIAGADHIQDLAPLTADLLLMSTDPTIIAAGVDLIQDLLLLTADLLSMVTDPTIVTAGTDLIQDLFLLTADLLSVVTDPTIITAGADLIQNLLLLTVGLLLAGVTDHTRLMIRVPTPQKIDTTEEADTALYLGALHPLGRGVQGVVVLRVQEEVQEGTIHQVNPLLQGAQEADLGVRLQGRGRAQR